MNTFGRNFRVTTFGESHGPAVGAVVDGCPPGIPLETGDIQKVLDRRRPGTSDLVSARQEEDKVEVLSGIWQGLTLGTPIALLVRNSGHHSSDYDSLAHIFRPGHADMTWQEKYRHRDYRGGGRSSGRETVGRVAAGAVAMKCLSLAGVLVSGSIETIHGVSGSEEMAQEIMAARDSGDSVGGTVVITVTGCPPGLGDPVFSKLDAALASAMMGIGAVKGVEIGSGFSAAGRYGSENNDPLVPGGLVTNNCGGILGGISTGSHVFIRIAVKPTPSISRTQQTIDDEKRPREVRISGRHDPCIVPRIVPVAESMAALVILDALLEQGMYTWYRSHVLPREV